jgi:hypothetical protein
MKLYKIIIAFLLTSLVFFLVSCSKTEEIITQELSYESFNTVNVKNYGNVSINYGTTQQVIFKGDANYLKNLTNEVVEGELLIQNNNIDFTNVKAEYIITLPVINEINIDGISSVVINDFDQTDKLTINIAGDGDVKVHQLNNVQQININASGNAQIEMLSNFDQLQDLNIKASGSLDFQGYLLQTQNSRIDFSGTGSIKLWVKELLNAKISGTGSIFYKGYPIINGNAANLSGAEIIDQN